VVRFATCPGITPTLQPSNLKQVVINETHATVFRNVEDCGTQPLPRPITGLLLLFFLTLGLELSDTKVYEPSIRALLGTASHYHHRSSPCSNHLHVTVIAFTVE
jgi:hypothetical protein